MNYKLSKRFSIPNAELPVSQHVLVTDPMSTYRGISQATEEFRSEISDIYFGHSFKYQYNGNPCRYGETMGSESTDGQIDALFKIQDEFGIPISLTLNSLNTRIELLVDRRVRLEFIDYIKKMYDRGLRICTISDIHLMASGILQENFPEMKWKNTVNHEVKSAQEVIDYAKLGYNIIQLDRSLNRNFDELVNIKRAAARCGIKTSLLVSELCLPACPFKNEHDSMQFSLRNDSQRFKFGYWDGLGNLSCNQWRTLYPMPRVGVDMIAANKQTMDFLLDHVDVFKFSGRMDRLNFKQDVRYGWRVKGLYPTSDNFVAFSSFNEIYENDVSPFHALFPIIYEGAAPNIKDSLEKFAAYSKTSDKIKLWQSKKGQALDKVLRTCKSQCWDCHACERTFGFEDMDSLVNLDPSIKSKFHSKLNGLPDQIIKLITKSVNQNQS